MIHQINSEYIQWYPVIIHFYFFCKSEGEEQISHFRLLRIWWQLTFIFRFSLKICQIIVLDNFTSRICLIRNTHDFIPCLFLLFFIFEKPFDVALLTDMAFPAKFKQAVKWKSQSSFDDMYISSLKWVVLSSNEGIFISCPVCINSFQSMSSSGLSSINSPVVIRFVFILILLVLKRFIVL